MTICLFNSHCNGKVSGDSTTPHGEAWEFWKSSNLYDLGVGIFFQMLETFTISGKANGNSIAPHGEAWEFEDHQAM